jgi:hypothetical protein
VTADEGFSGLGVVFGVVSLEADVGEADIHFVINDKQIAALLLRAAGVDLDDAAFSRGQANLLRECGERARKKKKKKRGRKYKRAEHGAIPGMEVASHAEHEISENNLDSLAWGCIDV